MKRLVFALTALSLASGCSLLDRGKKPTTPTVGQRIAILNAESDVQVDPALADVAITLPAPVVNDSWTQPGGNASKSMGHLGLGTALARAWSAEIGVGSSNRARLAASPVVAEGRVYTVDTMATLRAFDAATGAQVWTQRIGDPAQLRGGRNIWTGELTGNAGVLFGGGASYDNGRIYATNGLGDVAAYNAQTGQQVWRVRPGGPLRGAPTIANDNVYVVSQDNQLYALNPADGSPRWTGQGALELAGVFGSAAPAAGQGTVIGGFSSGELTAYRYENGRVVWQDALTRTSISTSVGALSDIDAEPVIHEGRVYAIGQGGRMVALELTTGQRIWEVNVAGIATPWVAGDWIFVVTDQAQLLAVARATGRVKWMTQLRRFRDEEDKKGTVSWVGPVLAGNRLILANSVGDMVNVSPYDGSVQSIVRTKTPITLQPVVAGNTLYVLDDRGRLNAWR
ncbi:MAG TPA: PQQ-binding-like beta-propeller repeat protein [Allosphingosinicella sp.]|nr:PQQ-binding-like beta-propeller repeat protein [Allosphingosinicella sp.]